MTVFPRVHDRARWYRYLLIVLLVCSSGVGGWYLFAFRRSTSSDSPSALRPDPPTPDPRETFSTRFRNVRPEVKYLGDASCAECHSTISGTYHAHPMGHSAEWVSHKGATDTLLAGANNPFTVAGYTLQVGKEGDRIVHRMSLTAPDESKLPAYVMPIDLVIGSGTHGRSYLTVDRGSVWQSPISWYHEGQRWDVSPGIDLATNSRRPITAECLHCHINRVEAIPNTLNRYSEPLLKHQANIGCERCHGPGELHVAERSSSAIHLSIPDYSIVNPRHLPSNLKADICRQCHLQGQAQIPRRGRALSEYRPGLPWDQFATTALPNPDLADYRKAVGQFEQMERSKCHTESHETLSCTNCHDPHFKPSNGDREVYFRDRCMNCHDTKRCTLPLPERQAKNDSCIGCHMPQRDSSNIVHAAITDHRIMKRPDDGRPRSQALLPGQSPIVLYPAGPHAPTPEERDRDLAIALGKEIARGGPDGPPGLLSLTKDKFDAALKRWPGDVAAWAALAEVYQVRGDTTHALEAAKSAAGLSQDGETYLMRLALVAEAADEHELAIVTATKLIDMNPLNLDYWLLRGTANVSLKQWKAVETDARAALTIHPLEPRAHLILGLALYGSGSQAKGRNELDIALELTPSPLMRSSLVKYWRQQAR